MPDREQPAATKSLRAWGFNTLKFADAFRMNKKLNIPQPARPDMYCSMNGRAVMVEVKSGRPSFDFNEWRPEQRDWAKQECIDKGTPYWIFLGLGLHSPGMKPKTVSRENYLPIQCYLVPFHVMISVEETLSKFQRSLPYRAAYTLVEMQNQGLNAPILLKDYALKYTGYQLWSLPEKHLFKRMYIDAPALPLPDAYLNMEIANGQRTGTAHRDSAEAIMQEIYHSSSQAEFNKVPLLAKTIPYRRPGKGSRKALRQATGATEQSVPDRNRESAAVNGASNPVGIVEPVGKQEVAAH